MQPSVTESVEHVASKLVDESDPMVGVAKMLGMVAVAIDRLAFAVQEIADEGK